MTTRREFLGFLAGAAAAGIFPPDRPILSEMEKIYWQIAIQEASEWVTLSTGHHDHFFCDWYESLR